MNGSFVCGVTVTKPPAEQPSPIIASIRSVSLSSLAPRYLGMRHECAGSCFLDLGYIPKVPVLERGPAVVILVDHRQHVQG